MCDNVSYVCVCYDLIHRSVAPACIIQHEIVFPALMMPHKSGLTLHIDVRKMLISWFCVCNQYNQAANKRSIKRGAGSKQSS